MPPVVVVEAGLVVGVVGLVVTVVPPVVGVLVDGPSVVGVSVGDRWGHGGVGRLGSRGDVAGRVLSVFVVTSVEAVVEPTATHRWWSTAIGPGPLPNRPAP